jgi:hypothetical protein
MLCQYDASGTCKQCGHIAESLQLYRNCPAVVASHEIEQRAKAAHQLVMPPPAHGPGTELSRLLKRLGIEPTPTCACRAKAAEMDAWGCDECSKPERIDEVVAVMRAEATARGLPFLDIAGRLLVRRAISNARRNA